MWPFRRRREETLNEILLREAGLADGNDTHPQTPVPTMPAPHRPADLAIALATGTSAGQARAAGVPNPSPTEGYDTVTVAHAPEISGYIVRFAVLPSGDVIVDEEEGDNDLSPFADAVEQQLRPPYRVLARRQDDDLWALTAAVIDVREFSFDAGDELELTCIDGDRTLLVDGERTEVAAPRELERAGEAKAADYAVLAERLDGDLWEVQASAL